MANDLNLCQFIGRLGKEVEMRYLPSGGAVASFSLAVGSKWRDKQSGEVKERTEWVNCSVFGKMAEVCGEYLAKGSQIYVSGEWRTEKWQDQSGNDRYSTKLNVRNMQMLGSKQGDAQQQQSGWVQPQQPTQQQRPVQQQSAQQPHYNEPPMDFDDEIPF